VFSSLDHVIHAGQKYTTSSPSGRGMSADYKSVFRLAYLAPFWRNGQKKSENREISANFDYPQKFFGSPPNI